MKMTLIDSTRKIRIAANRYKIITRLFFCRFWSHLKDWRYWCRMRNVGYSYLFTICFPIPVWWSQPRHEFTISRFCCLHKFRLLELQISRRGCKNSVSIGFKHILRINSFVFVIFKCWKNSVFFCKLSATQRMTRITLSPSPVITIRFGGFQHFFKLVVSFLFSPVILHCPKFSSHDFFFFDGTRSRKLRKGDKKNKAICLAMGDDETPIARLIIMAHHRWDKRV
jgi:hypothetical protein